MAAQQRNMPEQEHSIKVRSSELFVEETPVVPTTRSSKTFAAFLRETPAQPLSPGVQAMLWVLGIVVGLLFLIALWRVSHRHQKTTPTDAAPAEDAILRDVRSSHGAGPPRI
jgi:hypothetical protein